MTHRIRTDEHRPSVMDPAEYVYVGSADNHGDDSYIEIRHDILRRFGVETGEYNNHSQAGVPWYDANEHGHVNYACHHCGKHGTNIRYFIFFLHKPSSQVIAVGQVCAKKLGLGSREELDLQKRANAWRKQQERENWGEYHPEEYAFLQKYAEQYAAGERKFNEFYDSLWGFLMATGELTDRQLEAVQQGMVREARWDAERAGRRIAQTVDMATERQLDYLSALLDKRELDDEKRNEIRNRIEGGISKRVASQTIDHLKSLPEVEYEDE